MQRSQYGRSEEIAGKWFAKTGKRNDIFLATKFGYTKDHNGTVIGVDSSGEYAKKACAESLKALQTDWIDLCESEPHHATALDTDVEDYVHNVNRDTPIEDTMRGLADLQA